MRLLKFRSKASSVENEFAEIGPDIEGENIEL